MAEKELGYHDVTLPPDGQSGRLEIEFLDGSLKSARWGDEDLWELAAPGNSVRAQPEDFVGAWGLFHQRGTTWFQHPNVQLPGEPLP